MKKILSTISVFLTLWLFFTATALAAVNIPANGGTGIGSALSGDVGKVLTVSGNNPFTYSLTDASRTGTVTSVTASSPLTGGTFTTVGTIGCQTASGSQAGCLASADWNTFNGKQATGNYITALTGDGTASGPGSVALTLATVNINTGSWGTATQSPQFTVNGKGLITATASITITPAVGSITGLGTGVATALGVNVGTTGALVVNGGDLGTPSSGTVTNLTGTASININGTVGATTPTTGAFTTIAASGGYTQTGTSANTFTGTPTFSNATYSALFTGGNVGIGTTAPGQLLDVEASGSSYIQVGDTLHAANIKIGVNDAGPWPGIWLNQTTPSSLNYAFLSDGNTLFNTPASSNMQFRVGNATKMVIDTNGNVGIGTTSPSQMLSVGASNQFTVTSAGLVTAPYFISGGLVMSSINGLYYGIAAAGGYRFGTLTAGGAEPLSLQSGDGATYTGGYIQFKTDGTEKVRIDTNGNVGIGTTGPGVKLEIDSDNSVVGQLVLKSTAVSNSYPMFAFQNSSGANLGLFDSYGRMYLNAGQLSWLNPATIDTALGVSARISVVPAAIFAGANGQSVPVLQIKNYLQTTNASISDSGAAYFAGNVGIGTTTPTAYLHLKAGTATAGTTPLKFTSGVVNTTAEVGAMEYNGTNLSFVPTGTLRENIHTGGRGNITLTAGTTTTVTDATAKTTSTIMLTPTNLAATVATLRTFVATKNNGTFVLTTVGALGTETMDYLITN